MSSRKASNVVTMPDSAASTQHSTEAKITYNKRFGDESVTLRTSTVEELFELRDKLAEQMPGLKPAENEGRRDYFSENDSCPRPNCDGKLHLRSGTRGNFWGCSGYPTCRFTARA